MTAPTRDAIVDALRASGPAYLTTRELALAVYDYDDAAEQHAVRVAIYRARRAGIAIETRPTSALWEPAGYRLADGEGIAQP